MQIITKGSNYSSCGLGSIVVQDLKKELTAVFGADACTDERMIAIQNFMARLDWYNENGIFGKLSFVMLPFMSDGVASMSAFYDLKSKTQIKVGYSPVLDSSNVATHYTFDQYGCYPKKNADSSVKAAVIGYPMTGKKTWNSSEFALFHKVGSSLNTEYVGSCAAGRIRIQPQYNSIPVIRQSGGYIEFKIAPDIAGQTAANFCCYVFTGDLDISTSKVFTNKGECFARSESGEVNLNYNLDYVKFGDGHYLDSTSAGEQYSFSVMGHATGLTTNEASIVRDALMELKEALNL